MWRAVLTSALTPRQKGVIGQRADRRQPCGKPRAITRRRFLNKNIPQCSALPEVSPALPECENIANAWGRSAPAAWSHTERDDSVKAKYVQNFAARTAAFAT